STTTTTLAYGGLPAWLPTTTAPTGQEVAATPAHPQLAIEGDTVRVDLGATTDLVTVTGPSVPPFVAPPPPLTTATLTVSLRSLSGGLTVRASDFTLVDGNGVVLHPQFFVGGETAATVSPGRPAVVRVREFMAVGSGSILYAPAGRAIATWEFTVEND
ncbi:MAG: hypothetical protein ACRDV0_04765, partial [Acidimicrobiales bacterium]